MKNKPILVWPFDEAPKEYQNLSTNGGDEDWLAFVPEHLKEEWINWEKLYELEPTLKTMNKQPITVVISISNGKISAYSDIPINLLLADFSKFEEKDFIRPLDIKPIDEADDVIIDDPAVANAPKMMRCIVACVNANGQADLFPIRVMGTGEQFLKGDHLTKAEEAAEARGYEGPFVAFDEDDGMGKTMMMLFTWENAILIKI